VNFSCCFDSKEENEGMKKIIKSEEKKQNEQRKHTASNTRQIRMMRTEHKANRMKYVHLLDMSLASENEVLYVLN
jgi:hypothetical protein